MRKTIICVLLAVMMCALVACQAIEPAVPVYEGSSADNQGKLNILRSDKKLSQEQVMSQIKAQYLIENNGYKDTDDVVVILSLKDESLIQTYNRSGAISEPLGKFAQSDAGLAQARLLKLRQNELLQELTDKGLVESVEHSYTTIMNAIAVTVKYGNIAKLEKNIYVDSVILSDTYNMPQATKAESSASVIENDVQVRPTGIYDTDDVKAQYSGIHTAVAILDSGFDCSHTVFQNQPQGELLIKQSDVTAMLESVDQDGTPLSNAVKTSPNLRTSDVYYSDKIPFCYDYADKDANAFPYDSEHGTHVAGIIGGHDSVIEGVAINTQLVLMKVFPDLRQGAETDDILAALEDAVLLQVDAINMSLGSSCGFTREEDGNKINAVYDAINESGISLVTAASNAYSSAFGGDQGNTNMVTNPDSGTVGSPSTYEAALSVASISGTKSRYIIGTDSNGNNAHTFFFLESNAINGDHNDFMKELYSSMPNVNEGDTITLEYVTVPGVGMDVNYAAIDVKGKIALIRRGETTFEEKAQIAKNHGAVACIIYNNIDGDIYMSMGKSDHIPTVSISKDDGTILAMRKGGKMTLSYDNQAGPFMSDFSSWGPTPSLELKPDITAHGGNIKSAVPNGNYDELSGTSMASPNLCGVVVLIRQYLKDTFPEKSMKEVTVMANQLLMSTATVALNQEGNPYSPRKQGAGLASLYNAVNTKAYITVDGKNRAKLELFDDYERTGVYTMEFNVVNLSNQELRYNVDLDAMTESVSTSDDTHVSERAHMLNGTFTLSVNGQPANAISVGANATAKVKLVYRLPQSDMSYIDAHFPYGMYVEGFVKLANTEADGINLNVPFLAFYGNWAEAPMFDKTYYEVESEAHNQGIDDEDKIKADYYATTPYGSYWYNYIIPLGSYLYDIDSYKYDEIPGSEEHIAISNSLGTIDGIYSVYAGMLRNAKVMTYTITDKVSGEVVWEHIAYNSHKSHSEGGSPIPNFEELRFSSYKEGLVNNRQYEFKMLGLLDYDRDNGLTTNVRNSFSFDFYMDDEAPIIKEVSYEKTYDRTLKKDRYYLTMVVYDNHYVQAITPLILNFDGRTYDYSTLNDNPIPVYGEKGKDATVRFEITDYLEDIYADDLLTSGLAFSIDDYALNSNIYICQLPGTKGEFKFTSDGSMTGSPKPIIDVYQDEVVDLTRYLATADKTVDADKDYLKHLFWSSSDDSIVTVKEGIIIGHKKGKATITVAEEMDGKKTTVIINVKNRSSASSEHVIVSSPAEANIKSLRFSYFDTLFAYSRSAETSKIGKTGDREFLSSMGIISFYPGEKIKLNYDLDPWYAADNYSLEYSSTNESIAVVNSDGEVTALKKGNATITLRATDLRTNKVSNIMASVRLEVKSEFVIENRSLVSYKGLGGEVVIPDDEGILYIGAYAFCLYDTDRNIELTEDDYDANKIPASNTSVTSVVIPYGVEDIQKYAFYNCSGLREVSIPTSCKYIREYAFYNDSKLTTINVTGNEDKTVGIEGTKVEVIGSYAFYGCQSLEQIDLTKVLAIGIRAFDGCKSLKTANLTALRNSGSEAFRNCTALTSVEMNEHTVLSEGMFVRAGLTSVDIYEKVEIPAFCFALCKSLTTVNVHNSLVAVGKGAFSECPALANFVWGQGVSVNVIGEQAFYGTTGLTAFTLPNCNVELGNYCFLDCSNLATVSFGKDTVVNQVDGAIFQGTALNSIVVDAQNSVYASDTTNGLLVSKDGNKVIFAAVAKDFSQSELVLNYDEIGDGAFCGTNVVTVTFPKAVAIGDYAFANCDNLTTVNFASVSGNSVGKHAFNYASKLTTLSNLDAVQSVGDYAFANTGLKVITIGSNAVYGEGAFYKTALTTVTIGEGTSFGLGAFQECSFLDTVNMPANGGVHFGRGAFARDIRLKNIDLTKLGEKIEPETFYGCTSLASAILTGVKYVGDYAFADCSGLRTVEIPDVISLGEAAFGQYSQTGRGASMSSIVLPESLTYMGEGVFLGCEGLLSVSLPQTLTAVPAYSFGFCVNLAEVVLPATIQSIGEYAFGGCSELTTINLGQVKYIGAYAFAKASALQTVDLSAAEVIENDAFSATDLRGNIVANNLVTIGDLAFQSDYISGFTAPALKSIGRLAFYANNNLTKFVLSNSIEHVDLQAFYGCSNLASFYYNDNGTEKNQGAINSYALLDDGVLYTMLPSGNMQLTSVPAAYDNDQHKLVVLENTYRVDSYSGNENQNITSIQLPDALKLIGNYAFYGYKNLQSVEFRSFTAPALESVYDRNVELEEDAPGYGLLHGYFDLFQLDLCYFNFIDLAGRKQPIKMILPANSGLIGYDGLIYQVYFGKVEDAEHSQYVARDRNLVLFCEYAQKIAAIKNISLLDANLINNAVSAMNAITQDPTDYGYSADEWAELEAAVIKAKTTLRDLQLANASKAAQQVQADILALPDSFSIDDLAMLQELAARIAKLTPAERMLLDTTKYVNLQQGVSAYNNALVQELDGVRSVVENSYVLNATVAAAALAAAVIVLKRRFM